MPIFEILMLVCFGMSWPLSIAKSIRTKQVAGKSPLFLLVICIGYLSGIAHKVQFWQGATRDWVVLLYALNLGMVAFDLGLYYLYSQREGEATERTS
jgi:hypothetical protein